MTQLQLSRTAWLMTGIVAGFFVSHIWPHETMRAATSDRNETFAMVTSSTGSELGPLESVFILDFLTGRLVGATLDPNTGRFHRSYIRDVGADFRVQPRSIPKYTISSGVMPFSQAGDEEAANGVLYVSELTSGRVAAYGYPYSTSDKVLPTELIELLDVFVFRDITQGK